MANIPAFSVNRGMIWSSEKTYASATESEQEVVNPLTYKLREDGWHSIPLN